MAGGLAVGRDVLLVGLSSLWGRDERPFRQGQTFDAYLVGSSSSDQLMGELCLVRGVVNLASSR